MMVPNIMHWRMDLRACLRETLGWWPLNNYLSCDITSVNLKNRYNGIVSLFQVSTMTPENPYSRGVHTTRGVFDPLGSKLKVPELAPAPTRVPHDRIPVAAPAAAPCRKFCCSPQRRRPATSMPRGALPRTPAEHVSMLTLGGYPR